MGITTAMDVLSTYPRDWQDRRRRFSLREVPIGERTALVGKVSQVRFKSLRRDLGMVTATLRDTSGSLKVVWFKKSNPRYDVFAPLLHQLETEPQIMAYGVLELGIEGRQFRVEEMGILNAEGVLNPEDAIHLDRLAPLYTVPEGLNERLLRSMVSRVLPQAAQAAVVIPEWLTHQRKLPQKAWALKKKFISRTPCLKKKPHGNI